MQQQPPEHESKDVTPRVTRKKTVLKQSFPILLVVLGLLLLALITTQVINLFAGKEVISERPISDILQMAEQHTLKEAHITTTGVTATDHEGKQYHANKENGQVLTDILRAQGVKVTIDGEGSVQAWQTALSIVVLVTVAGSLVFFIRKGALASGNGTASFTRSRARKFTETHPSILFKDVAGVNEAKEELAEIVEYLKSPERFLAMGARTPKGVLLVGAPGTGKTLISRAVAGEAGVAFYNVSGSEFTEMFVGVGAARVRDLFKEARENAPCIIFIDEIDAVGRQRTQSMTGGNDEREQTLNQLLVEMDGFDKQTNIVVIAATNRPDILDQALLRPGRFDRRVTLDKPDIHGRLEILKVHAAEKPLHESVTLEHIAQQTPGFSGADLANVLNEAALLAARFDRQQIEKEHVEEAILRVMAGPERKSRVITEAEKAIISYHEVGHAIVMRMTPGSDPVRKVTAIARGQALGITVSAPTEDRYLLRRSELLAKMAGAMGGRAAEELIFGDITTGASQDIEYVTSIARRMVCEFGMTELGMISVKLDEGQNVSAQTAAKIDAEVSRLVDQAYQSAISILQEQKEKLIVISEHLMRVETIDGTELDAMLFTA